MKYIALIIKWGAGILATLVALIVLPPVILELCGFYVFHPGWEVAEILVKEHKDVNECKKIKEVPWNFGGPSAGLRRLDCIHDFASLTKDPAICGKLPPSELVLACLSDIGGKIFAGQPCSGTLGSNEVLCIENESGKFTKIDEPQLQNCMRYKRTDLQDWCFQTRTYQYENVYECSLIKNLAVRDQCENGYAFKQKDPTLCSAVKDLKRRDYCNIRINTWLKYPELRSSFYFGISVPID